MWVRRVGGRGIVLEFPKSVNLLTGEQAVDFLDGCEHLVKLNFTSNALDRYLVQCISTDNAFNVKQNCFEVKKLKKKNIQKIAIGAVERIQRIFVAVDHNLFLAEI